MAIVLPPLRIGLDLHDRGLTALVSRPEEPLRVLRAELVDDTPLPTALAALLHEQELAAPKSGGKTPLPEIVVASSRPWSVLHRRAVRVALLISEGFEDLLVLGGRALDPVHISAGLRLSELCPREHCLGVPERLAADGTVVRPLTAEALHELRQRVADLKVSAVAVVLLHSYQNDAHERTVAEALLPLGLPVSLSSAVFRVPDERLRARATLLDACLAATLREDLAAVHSAGGAVARVLCGDSAGNAVPAAQILPLHQVLGSVGAGLRGAQRIAAAHGIPRFLALSLDGEEQPAMVALHDPHPRPQPGTQAESPGPRQAWPLPEIAVELPVRELQIVESGTPEDVQDRLLAALLAITIERGHDPANYPLLCYGSARPLLAATLAERLGAHSALVLPTPDLVTAYGALCAPVFCERRELLFVEASSAQQTGQVAGTLHALTARLREDLTHEGFLTSDHLRGYKWQAEMRYQGQGPGTLLPHPHALLLEGYDEGGPAVNGATDLVVRFCIEHQRRYGYTLPECPVELVALRVSVTLPPAGLPPHASELSKLAGQGPGPEPGPEPEPR